LQHGSAGLNQLRGEWLALLLVVANIKQPMGEHGVGLRKLV
jgi:hypothetical protein